MSVIQVLVVEMRRRSAIDIEPESSQQAWWNIFLVFISTYPFS